MKKEKDFGASAPVRSAASSADAGTEPLTKEQELRLFAQGWVWASADHLRCGGDEIGACKWCDARAEELTKGVIRIFGSGNQVEGEASASAHRSAAK